MTLWWPGESWVTRECVKIKNRWENWQRSDNIIYTVYSNGTVWQWCFFFFLGGWWCGVRSRRRRRKTRVTVYGKKKTMMVVDRFHGRYSWFPTSLPYFKYGMTKLNWIRNLHLVHVFRFVLIDINYFLFSFLFLKRQNNCNNNNS